MLLRLLTCCVLWTCAAAVAQAQVDVDDLPLIPPGELPYEILDDWNVKCYGYFEYRQTPVKAIGSTVKIFRPQKVDEVLTATWLDERGINILDDWRERGDARRLQERVYAQTNPFLTVDRVCFRTNRHLVRGNREDDLFVYTIDGAPGSEPMYETTLTVATFMRLVTLLPMEPGKFAPRRILNIPEIELNNLDLPIICHGPDTIMLRGFENECTKYSYNGYTAWVRSADRVLVRLELPDRRFLELMKDGTCCAGERLRQFVEDIREELDDEEAAASVPGGTPATPAVPPANPLPF